MSRLFIVLSLLFCVPSLAYRADDFELDSVQLHAENDDAEIEHAMRKGAGGCEMWCKRKVDQKEMCKDEVCTWNILCGWKSGKCSTCSECDSLASTSTPISTSSEPAGTCEAFCARKVNEQEMCNDQVCTWSTLCGWKSRKCSACSQCKSPESTPISTSSKPAGMCETWCPRKVGKPECGNSHNEVCTWSTLCSWSSQKCSACEECAVAEEVEHDTENIEQEAETFLEDIDKAIEHDDELELVPIEGSYQLAPDFEDAEGKMGFTFSLNKAEPTPDKGSWLEIKLEAQSNNKAKKFLRALNQSTMARAFGLTWSRPRNQEVIITTPPFHMNMSAHVVSVALKALPELEFSEMIGASFEDFMKNPQMPILSALKSLKVSFEASIARQVQKVVASRIPENAFGNATFITQKLILLFAGIKEDLKVAYDEDTALVLHDAIPMTSIMSPAALQGLAGQMMAVQKKNLTDPIHAFHVDEMKKAYRIIEKAVIAIKSIKSLTLKNIPGGAELACQFHGTNPFPFLKYVIDSWKS